MAMDKAVEYVRGNGPMTPDEVANMYKKDNGHYIGKKLWENSMEAARELVKDDSGRFHLRGDLRE